MAQGEIERQGIYRFQNFFDMGIPIFVAKIFLVHVGYVYVCEQISFRLSERLRERGGDESRMIANSATSTSEFFSLSEAMLGLEGKHFESRSRKHYTPPRQSSQV